MSVTPGYKTQMAASSFVASITGTVNQIVASAAFGAVTLSVPSDFRVAGTITGGNLTYTPLSVGTFLDTGSTALRGLSNVQISGDAGSASFNLLKARGIPGAETIITTGDTIGNMKGWGYDGAAYLNMASIRFVSTGTIALNRIPTQIEFYTATDAGPSVLTLAATINKAQQFVLIDGSSSAPSQTYASETGMGWFRAGSGVIARTASGTVDYRFTGNGLEVYTSYYIGWGSSGISSLDVFFRRTAPNTLSLGKTSGAADATLAAGIINAATKYQINGVDGVTASGATLGKSLTIVNGLVTAYA